MTLAALPPLPRWDVSSIFPGLESREFSDAFDELLQKLQLLESSYDRMGVNRSPSVQTLEPASAKAAITGYNELHERFNTLRAYIAAHTSTNSRDDAALARASELDPHMARLGKLLKRLAGWLGTADTEALLVASEVARQHEFFVRSSQKAAAHQMEPELEALASDLEITGSVAWQRLYSKVTSQLSVDLRGDKLPMSSIRALASNADRTMRSDAYEAELAAWKSTEVTLAAAMNSIKGESLQLANRRGWDSPLDAAIFASNIDRAALDAMLGAARRSFPDFRRYLKIKAKALGIPKLAWYDIFAPLPGQQTEWEYREAERFVGEQFGTYSGRLGSYARRAFDDQWIDAEPRSGKVDGAFCMSVVEDESRILLNYSPAFNSVSTLAHELGHGYHNLCLHGRTAIQRFTPMTLAETASIFCETIVRSAVLATGTDAEKREVVQASLQGSCQVVVDITSRFLFEKGVFERRTKRELSPSELCDLMLEAQRETYGDGLDSAQLHPYMWAAKPHYYGRSFYNFPYMFGLLFGLGLFAIYQKDGEGFIARYDDLLGSTGSADAATLAAGFGIDIRSEEFWDGSFDKIRSDIDLFDQLIG